LRSSSLLALGLVTLLAFRLGALFIAFALYIPTQEKLDIANADLEHANATITGNTDQITTLQTGNEALLETLDSTTLTRMSLQLQVREGGNGLLLR
jgi:hypothetical protein